MKFKKCLLVLLATILLSVDGVSKSFAESQNVTGTVTIKGTNEPLLGANVIIQGTDRGSMTDVNGYYSIGTSSSNSLSNLEDGKSYSLEITCPGGGCDTLLKKNSITIPYIGGAIDVSVTDSTSLDEIIIKGKTKEASIAERAKYDYIEGKVFNIKGEPLEGVEIYSKKINEEIARIVKDLGDTNEEDVSSDVSFKNAKDGDKIIFLSNSSGEFYLKTENLLPGDYDLSFNYKTNGNIYEEILDSVEVKDGESISLRIKMYSGCETGGQFDSDCLFPAWSSDNKKKESSREEIRGIYGKNKDGAKEGEDKIALSVIPNIIDIILKFISPIVVGMFIFAGVRFIYAGSDEEDLTKAKDFFLYAGIGLAFIIMSYTLMKVLYFFLR